MWETIISLAEKSLTTAFPMILDWAKPQVREQLTKTVILTAMEIEAESSGKPICYPSGTAGLTPPGKFDAELPEGLDSMTGPLVVALCAEATESTPAEFDRILTQVTASPLTEGLLFVHTAELNREDKNRLEQMVAQAAPRHVHLWGPDEIRNLLNRQWGEIESRFPALTQLSIRAGLQTPEADWQGQSVERLNRLADIYRKDGIVLVLGAGVSANMNIPDWEQLLSSLYTALIAQQFGEIVDEKKLFPSLSDEQVHPLAEAARKIGGGESPLLSARYLRKGFRDTQSFQQVLSAALYKHVANGQKSPPLLKELAKLCMPRRTGPRVSSVITYNFDDLLESVLEAEGIYHRSLYLGGQKALEDELPIFHPHGFLPKETHRYDRLEESMLTFSEEAYHRVFRDPYHWANTVQLQAFQQNSCLLVGLSLTDPNLRRLLEFGRTGGERPRHFAFMRRTSLDELMGHSPKGADGKPQVHVASAKAFLALHHRLQEGVLAELGLEVIWFESYNEMPEAVKKIRA